MCFFDGGERIADVKVEDNIKITVSRFVVGSYMDRTAAFEKQRMSFGKVDASCSIRKAFGSLRPAV